MQLGSGNGTSFPTSVDTATTEINAPAAGKTKARAEVINDVLSAIVAIETTVKDGTALPKYPSVQQVVTGSRAADATVYQNTTGRPMCVSATVYCSATSGAFFVKTNATATPTTVVAQPNFHITSNNAITITFFVLPGNYYSIGPSTGTPGVAIWTEWY